MNILITGGCGFIGSHLAEYCVSLGHKVCVVDDLSAGSINNVASLLENPDFVFVQADITKWAELTPAVQWSDCIFHMAAVVGTERVVSDPIGTLNTNIHGCELIFEAIAASEKRPRVVIGSSSMVYGMSKKRYQTESDALVIQSTLLANWIYAITKVTDEAVSFAYSRAYNIPTTIVRLFNVIGPRQHGRYGMVVPRFVGQACSNENITVYGDGSQTRSFCDIRDVVKILMLLVMNEKSIGEIVNIGSDNEITIRKLAEKIKSLAKSKSKIVNKMYSDVFEEGFVDVHFRKPDLLKMQQLTGFKKLIPLDESILEIIAQFNVEHPHPPAVMRKHRFF